MLFDNAALYKKLVDTLKTAPKAVVWNYEGFFIVKDVTMPTININVLERIIDCNMNSSELVVVSVQVSSTMYNKFLLPNKSNLKFKLIKNPQASIGMTAAVGTTYSQTFNAFLTNPASSHAMQTAAGGSNDATDNLSGLVTIEVQLVDPLLYEFRTYEVGGIYKDVNVTNLLTGLMAQPLISNNNLDVPVDMVPADNPKQYYQMIIPNGIRLGKLPDYIQNKYGVYSSGMGVFLQKGQWYLFPLLNIKRWNETTRTLTILVIPGKEMPANDKSYILEGKALIVYSSDGGVHLDKSEHHLTNVGRGVRYSVNSNMIDNFAVASEDKVEVPVGQSMKEISTEAHPSGFANMKSNERLLSDNPYKQMSDITAGMSSLFVTRWEYANSDLLYPGMPTRILYKHGEEIKLLNGSLIKTHTKASASYQNKTDKRYVTVCELTVNCERL